MRYILIDKEKMTFSTNFGEASIALTSVNSTCVLSEEENLAKFREIWQNGNDSGFSNGFDGYITPITQEQDWEEFKETL